MTESWSQLGAAVRTAQAIGLHRDGADMVSVAPRMFQLVLIESQGMESVQVERRRRIW